MARHQRGQPGVQTITGMGLTSVDRSTAGGPPGVLVVGGDAGVGTVEGAGKSA